MIFPCKKDRENAKQKTKATTTRNIPMKIACIRLKSPCLIQRVTLVITFIVKGELKATGQIFYIHRLLPIMIDTTIIVVKHSKKLRISMRKWHKTKRIPQI